MANINVTKKEDKRDGWQFTVYLEGEEGKKYSVFLEKKYYEKLAQDIADPEDLVEKSFEFLLDREPQSSILKEFSIKEINNYFGDYEEKIKEYLE
ncbi:MAG: hypothetical protein ABEI53_03075 [Candidatus Magasanikbacteria bacterium]